MPTSVQEYLANLTLKASADLEKSLLRIPHDKRTWSPEGKARTALDQVAEVALLSGTTAHIIRTHAWPADYSFDDFFREKAELAGNFEGALAKLHEAAPLIIEAIRSTPDEALEIELQMPWGSMTIAQIIAYPYWNMTYHEGQINYIASILGVLD